MANNEKERSIAASLLETDDLGLISWDSYIDDLSTNLYVDEKKTGDNTYNGTRSGFDEKYRTTILAGDATGTLGGQYLNPRPLINKLAQTYREARHDEIPMNIKNMDYTNKIKREEDEEEGDYMIGDLTPSELYAALDLCNDGVVGIDDARAILSIYQIYSTHAEAYEVDFFKQIFGQTSEATLDSLLLENDSNWHEAFETVLRWNDDGEGNRTQAVLTFDNYHNKGTAYAYNVLYTDNKGDLIPPSTVSADQAFFYIEPDQVTRYYDDDTPSHTYYEYITYYLNDTSGTIDIKDCAEDFMDKIIKLRREGDLKIDSTLASTVLYIIDNAKAEGHEDRAYVTLEEFTTFIEENDIFPMSDADKLKRCLNLLMPRYARRVEVEDLDKNFWVIGQVLDALAEAVWRDDGIVDAIQAIIKQLNNLTNQVNAINILLGLNGDTSISLRGGKWTTMTDGYGFDTLYARIQKGNGVREIHIPINDNLYYLDEKLDYTSWENFVLSWNTPDTGESPLRNWSPGRGTPINIWDLFACTLPLEIKGSDQPTGGAVPGTSVLMEGSKVCHPFFRGLSKSSDIGWYYETLQYMCNTQVDEFKFVKDVNILLYNPKYYAYQIDGDEFTLTEYTASDKSVDKKTYHYNARKVLAKANLDVAELELIMINFNPKQAELDKIAVDGISLPANNFSQFDAMDMHAESGKRANYRYTPNFVLKQSKQGQNIGIGIQYYSPALVDKNKDSLRKTIKIANILPIKGSMMNSKTGETSQVSKREMTMEFLQYGLSSNLEGFSATHTLYGESGRIGNNTYNVSTNSFNNGISQGPISGFLTNSGLVLSSYDNGVEDDIQSRCFVANGAIVRKASKLLTLSSYMKSSSSADFDASSSDNTIIGWYSKDVIDLQNIFDFSGNNIFNISACVDSSNHVVGLGKIRNFVEGMGLQYGNAFAVAVYPNEINPTKAPEVPTAFINSGDAHVADVRHARQIIFMPIYYNVSGTGYNDNIYIDTTQCGVILLNWEAQSQSQMTDNSNRTFCVNNLDNYWLDGVGAPKSNTDIPIGFAVICASADMPDFATTPTSGWNLPCGTTDAAGAELFGKAALGTYLFEKNGDSTDNFTMPNFEAPDGAISISLL